MVTSDFEELFKCCNARSVRLVIVSSDAFSFHAKPRYTKDIDLFVESTPDNARRLLQALGDFGFSEVKLKVENFNRAGLIVQLGVPPNRVDVMTSIDGVTFDDAWAGRVEGL